ncbi:MAG: mechanosensitive ion channel family protein [Paludibacter sp.]|jgi:MscS family membrane protein|nr:mechanosensitive ion channel family protein [Paludibacter sp.]
MFSHIYFHNSLQNWLISLAIIAAAFIVNIFIFWLNILVFKPLSKRTTHSLDDALFDKLESPLKFAIVLLGIWISCKRLDLPENIDIFIATAYKFLIVLNITWFIVRFTDALITNLLMPAAKNLKTNRKKFKTAAENIIDIPADTKKSKKQKANDEFLEHTLMPIVRRVILGVIWVIGVMMALKNVGVDVGALLAGLGIGGLAFALAAQDTLKNIFGGITILTDQAFKVGDRIKVDGFDGTVEDIGMRSTRIRTLEKRLVTIPNYKMSDVSIENVTREPMRRMLIKIGLTYDTTPEKMQQAIDILKDIPNNIKEVEAQDLTAVFSDFSTSSLDITFIYWINSKGDAMGTPSKVNFEILTKFNQQGLNFAFPSQTIYVNQE